MCRLRRGMFGMIILFGMFFFLPRVTQGAYLQKVKLVRMQPDGEKIELFFTGDEFFGRFHDASGCVVVQDARGYFVYAEENDGAYRATDVVVGRIHQMAKRSLAVQGLPAKLAESIATKKREYNQLLQISRGPTLGDLNMLGILVRFKDQIEFKEELLRYESCFNDVQPGANSVRNYFYEVSYGKLDISTRFYPVSDAGVVSYQDEHPRAYYVPFDPDTNPIGYKDQQEARMREAVLVKNAIEFVRPQIPVDLKVDFITFIIRGEFVYPTAVSAFLLYPHAMPFFESVSINGNPVGWYSFQIEQGIDMYGTAVLSHEMFHCMGAPDLYRADVFTQPDKPYDPIGYWGLMVGAHDPAPHPGAYMKYEYGKWIEQIPLIDKPGTYTLKPLYSQGNNCYRINSPYVEDEYFIIEYRKFDGTFEGRLTEYADGPGLLVYRIYSKVAGNILGPADEVYLYRPEGSLIENGLHAQAALNADLLRTTINDDTDPRSFLKNDAPGGLRIFNVSSAGESISFEVQFVDAPLLDFVHQKTGLIPGTHFTLVGNSLEETEGRVIWKDGPNEVDCEISSWSDTEIMAVAPAVPAGLYDCYVLDSLGKKSKTLKVDSLHPTYALESFEDAYPPVDWQIVSHDPMQTWFPGGALTKGSGMMSIGVVSFAPVNEQNEWLISNEIDFSGHPNTTLVFWMSYAPWLALIEDGFDFVVHVSTDGGKSFEPIWSESQITAPVNPFQFLDMQKIVLDLSAYNDQPSVKVAFQYIGRGPGFITLEMVQWTAPLKRDDLLGSWDGMGVMTRNSDTGEWVHVSKRARQVATGDLDGDGIDDVVGLYDHGLYVKSSSTQQWSKISSSCRINWIASGDMNGDGLDDVVISKPNGVFYKDVSSDVWHRLGKQNAYQIAVADIDNDGVDDLVGLYRYGLYLKQSGSGQWIRIHCSWGVQAIATGDMNADGVDDIVISNLAGVSYRDSVSEDWHQLAEITGQVVTGDLDGDAVDDLITASISGVFVKYSRDQRTQKLADEPISMTTGKLR